MPQVVLIVAAHEMFESEMGKCMRRQKELVDLTSVMASRQQASSSTQGAREALMGQGAEEYKEQMDILGGGWFDTTEPALSRVSVGMQ